jgi:hypothetical protein
MTIVSVRHRQDDGTHEYVVTPQDDFTFGRGADCALVLGRGDQGISRIAGRIEFGDGGWWVVNESSKRPIEVIDAAANRSTQLSVVGADGVRDRCPIGRSAVDVVLTGAARDPYGFRVVPVRVTGPGPDQLDPAERSTVLVKIPDRQLEALIALAWGYLQPFPDHRPEPASYAEVGRRIGCTARRAGKLIDLVRQRMAAARLSGFDEYAYGTDSRALVCRHALALRLIGSDSCAWLERRLETRTSEPTRELDELDGLAGSTDDDDDHDDED